MSKKGEISDQRGKVKSDFPKHTLAQTLEIARTIEETNGGKPLPPTDVAIALGISPGGSDFRMRLSSSLKYGLTVGSYKQERIALTDIGRRLASPLSSDDQHEAMLTAALTPETFRRMYEYFKGKKLPESTFFQNAVVREFGIPREHADRCIEIFSENADAAGLIRIANTGKWLSIDPLIRFGSIDDGDATIPSDQESAGNNEVRDIIAEPTTQKGLKAGERRSAVSAPAGPDQAVDERLSKVFVTHGRNRELVPQLKELLTFGKLIPIVSIERESVSKPVPDKVLDDMRACGAALIHVDAERRLVDVETSETVVVLNPNVLIEIGAAMALYGRRFILLVQKDVKLPSNLQGLYQVFYDGDRLDGDATLKLLKTFNDIRNHSIGVKIDGS